MDSNYAILLEKLFSNNKFNSILYKTANRQRDTSEFLSCFWTIASENITKFDDFKLKKRKNDGTKEIIDNNYTVTDLIGTLDNNFVFKSGENLSILRGQFFKYMSLLMLRIPNILKPKIEFVNEDIWYYSEFLLEPEESIETDYIYFIRNELTEKQYKTLDGLDEKWNKKKALKLRQEVEEEYNKRMLL